MSRQLYAEVTGSPVRDERLRRLEAQVEALALAVRVLAAACPDEAVLRRVSESLLAAGL
jgi:hypothetical protein